MKKMLKRVVPYLLVIVLVDYAVLVWNHMGNHMGIWPLEGILVFPLTYFLVSLLCALKNGWIPQFPFAAALVLLPAVIASRSFYAIIGVLLCLSVSYFAVIVGGYFHERTYE